MRDGLWDWKHTMPKGSLAASSAFASLRAPSTDAHLGAGVADQVHPCL